jgi:hypothetical protein
VPAAGLRWTLALDRPDGTGEHGVLAVRRVPGLESPLLVRPDGYLAAYGVSTEPEKVLDQLSSYLPVNPTR